MNAVEKPAPSEKDLEYAAELRELIHQKALEKPEHNDTNGYQHDSLNKSLCRESLFL